MEQNQPQSQKKTPPAASARSAVVEATIGAAMGSTIGLITSLFNKKMPRGKQVLMGALAGAAFGTVQSMFASPAQNQTQPPAEPPMDTPPPVPTLAGELQLGKVPKILDLLVERNQLTRAQQNTVLTEIKSGRVGFAGELAVANGFITDNQLEHALADQAVLKAEAAIVDIQALSAMTEKGSGAIAASPELKANWGSNGVNPSNPNTSCTYGASAAANNAQNLVMMAFSDVSHNPALIAQMHEGVIAAANLTRGIAQGDSAVVPLSKMGTQWRETMNKALHAAAAANPQLMVDGQGNPVDINSFITARDAEIATAVQQALATGKGCQQTLGRA